MNQQLTTGQMIFVAVVFAPFWIPGGLILLSLATILLPLAILAAAFLAPFVALAWIGSKVFLAR